MAGTIRQQLRHIRLLQ